MGRTLGTVMAGIFATVVINPGGANGFLFGNPHQPVVQIQSVFVVALYSFVVSLVLFKIIDSVMGLRVSDDEETVGLDITQYGEAGYTH